MKNKNIKKLTLTTALTLIFIISITFVLVACNNKNNNQLKFGAQNGTTAYYTINQQNRASYTSPAAAVSEVINGTLTGLLADEEVAKELVKQNNDKIKYINETVDIQKFAFITKKGNTEFLKQVNNWLESEEGKKIVKDAINLKIKHSIDELQDTYKEDDKDSIVVYTSADYPPYENKNGNKIEGIDITIAIELGKALGKKVKIKNSNFDGVIPGVQNSNSNYALGMAGLSITNERKEQVDFTHEYVNTKIVLIVKKDNTKFDSYNQEDLFNLVNKGKYKNNNAK